VALGKSSIMKFKSVIVPFQGTAVGPTTYLLSVNLPDDCVLTGLYAIRQGNLMGQNLLPLLAIPTGTPPNGIITVNKFYLCPFLKSDGDYTAYTVAKGLYAFWLGLSTVLNPPAVLVLHYFIP